MITVRRIEDKQTRAQAALFIDVFHSYISFADRPSRKLYWMIAEDGVDVGVFALGSAFVRPKAFAEWMESEALEFNQVANNIVFCLAGHKDRNAGSRALALCRRDAVAWWKARYGDDLRAFQTFILPPRTGAVYKADNWRLLGETVGFTTRMETLRPEEFEALSTEDRAGIEVRTFKSGEVKRLRRVPTETDRKLIFARRA